MTIVEYRKQVRRIKAQLEALRPEAEKFKLVSSLNRTINSVEDHHIDAILS